MRSAGKIGGGSPKSRGGSKVEFMLRRREGGMGRGNWWMLASPVQVPRKGKGDMEGLSPALQASTGGYRSILEQADQCVYVCSDSVINQTFNVNDQLSDSRSHTTNINPIRLVFFQQIFVS